MSWPLDRVLAVGQCLSPDFFVMEEQDESCSLGDRTRPSNMDVAPWNYIEF